MPVETIRHRSVPCFFAVAVRGNDKAYLSSMRDGEVVVLDLSSGAPRVAGRIPVGQQPNRLILDRAQRRLFVANANGDSVSVVDTATDLRACASCCSI
jgi:DNA-binding beta-propeller fold protein YncE